jgi:hypothetical protein
VGDAEGQHVHNGGVGGGAAASNCMEYFSAFPSSIKYLVWNEFCERFSFFSMKSILALYFLEHLHLSENESTESVHLFIVACFATPLLGAFLGDCKWVRMVSFQNFPFVFSLLFLGLHF